jgi:uncharacterized membrane protein YkvA (DUF1232 family)
MENYGKYAKFYSNESFWNKLKGFAGKAGIKVVYMALLLYYMLVDDMIDLKSKVTIAAGLGYFIFPFDLIPDFLPIIGFTDDLSVLMITLSIVRGQINDTHRLKARGTMAQWFQGINEEKMFAVEQEK